MDLGILIDDQLESHEHSQTVVCKTVGVAQNILKGTVCREPEFMTDISDHSWNMHPQSGIQDIYKILEDLSLFNGFGLAR